MNLNSPDTRLGWIGHGLIATAAAATLLLAAALGERDDLLIAAATAVVGVNGLTASTCGWRMLLPLGIVAALAGAPALAQESPSACKVGERDGRRALVVLSIALPRTSVPVGSWLCAIPDDTETVKAMVPGESEPVDVPRDRLVFTTR